MIETKHLGKSFFCKNREIKALSDFNLTVDRGEIFGLLGPSGAGKTTTIKILSTLLFPSAGQAYVAGFDCLRQPQLVRKSIGVVFGHTLIYHRLTGRANLIYYGKLYDVENLDRKIKELAEFFELTGKLDQLVETYSTGMKAKLALMRGMIHNPAVLFFDEPTLGLDPTSAKNLQDRIKQLQDMKKTILLCTHHLLEAEHLCSRIGILRKGKLIASDTPYNLRRHIGKERILSLELAKPLIKNITVVGRLFKKGQSTLFIPHFDHRELDRIMIEISHFKLAIKTFSMQEKTLEDVYHYYVGKK